MSTIRRVSAEQGLALLREGYAYLDVRTEVEYAAGHPVGAYNVPWQHAGPRGMEPNPDFLATVDALFARDAKLLVGCKAGARSLCAAEALAAAGYTGVCDLRPGFGGLRNPFGQVAEVGWEGAGLPIEVVTEGRSYAELAGRVGE